MGIYKMIGKLIHYIKYYLIYKTYSLYFLYKFSKEVLNLKVAAHWRELNDNKLKCELCPHYCIIAPEGFGKCRVRKNIDGILYTLNYEKVISYALDPIEKKPLSNFMPDSIISSIGTYGCNLVCDFCQNYQLVNFDREVPSTPSMSILDLVLRDRSIGLAYTYNEPTVWFEYVLETAKLIKDYKLINVLVTNGFINEVPFRELAPYIDAMNIDYKFFNPVYYKNICAASPEPVVKTISLANSLGIHVEITTLLISGLNTSEEDVNGLVDMICEINPEIPLHLSRYFPAYKRTDPPTEMNDLYRAYEIAKSKLKHVYLGNV